MSDQSSRLLTMKLPTQLWDCVADLSEKEDRDTSYIVRSLLREGLVDRGYDVSGVSIRGRQGRRASSASKPARVAKKAPGKVAKPPRAAKVAKGGDGEGEE